MREEPLLTENRWQRLEAEGCGHLQTVEEANEDAYGEEDEGFDETLQEEEEYVENAISGGDLSIEELYGEPSVEDLYNFEVVPNNWQPGLNLIAPLPTPEPRRDPEGPLELFAIDSAKNPNLPVYVVQVGPPKATYPANAMQFILVRTILDTGAEANYITLHKAHLAKAQLFSINT